MSNIIIDLYKNELDGWKGFQITDKGAFCMMNKNKTFIFLPVMADDKQASLIIREVKKIYD